MGIKNLIRHIRKAGIVKKALLNSFQGKKIAVDTSYYIHSYWYIALLEEVKNYDLKKQEPEENKLINRFIQRFLHMVLRLISREIQPIFVIDGEPPQEKMNTVLQRKESKQVYLEKLNEMDTAEKLKKAYIYSKSPPVYTITRSIKLLLESIGVSYIEAKGEAERLCSMLATEGRVDAVLSPDSDNLVFGCPVLILDIKDDMMETVYLKDVLEHFQIDFSQFVTVCILSGCDYNKSIPYLGFKRILNLIKQFPDTANLLSYLREKYKEHYESLNFEKCLDLFSKKFSDEIVSRCCMNRFTKENNSEKISKLIEAFDIKILNKDLLLEILEGRIK